jgi:hypothetical protein
MGGIKDHPPCLALVAAFSRYDFALDWLMAQVERQLGPIAMQSQRYEFSESAYYQPTMGEGLKKQFFVLGRFYDPSKLASDKHLANRLEIDFAASHPTQEVRPLNVDPGYFSLTKLVLASTKNREHRVYLQEGVYGEVTLAYRDQTWQPMQWTYPDYQREDFRLFFESARQHLLLQMRSMEKQIQKN